MKKKFLLLFIITISLSELFAESAADRKIVLNATKQSTPYTFIIQYNNKTDDGQTSTVSGLELTTDSKTTPSSFTIELAGDGNVNYSIAFTAKVTTGEFVDAVSGGSAATDFTGLYPEIVDDSANIYMPSHPETVTYHLLYAPQSRFKEPYKSSYTVTFGPGKHKEGTEIARFQLRYKGDSTIVAGAYRSTSIIAITSEEVATGNGQKNWKNGKYN